MLLLPLSAGGVSEHVLRGAVLRRSLESEQSAAQLAATAPGRKGDMLPYGSSLPVKLDIPFSSFVRDSALMDPCSNCRTLFSRNCLR
jgi:hypothetical protein